MKRQGRVGEGIGGGESEEEGEQSAEGREKREEPVVRGNTCKQEEKEGQRRGRGEGDKAGK